MYHFLLNYLKIKTFFFSSFSHDSGVDNPFRPDGDLAREADTIVSLIKEGKPITPIKGEEPELDGVVSNGLHHDQTDSLLTGPISPNGKEVQEVVITPNSTTPVANKPKSGANGSTPKDQKVAPGVVEVQHSVIVPPSDAPAVEQVVIKKKPKCKCCVIQ